MPASASSIPGQGAPIRLDLTEDVALLTATLMDIESVSGNERALADAIEDALRAYGHLEVHRDGDSIVARTLGGTIEAINRADGGAEVVVRLPLASLTLRERHEHGH